jgi:hypothetical protein
MIRGIWHAGPLHAGLLRARASVRHCLPCRARIAPTAHHSSTALRSA